jgi:hypothetical protein
MKGNIMENTTPKMTAIPAMRMPRQSAGVDRSESGVAAARAEAGAEAAGIFDTLLKIGKGLVGF